jgi:CO dehydrogenase/acetyl-CoA synthase alpha subunit
LSIKIGAGNEQDSKPFKEIIEAIGDSAYDAQDIRAYLRHMGIKANLEFIQLACIVIYLRVFSEFIIKIFNKTKHSKDAERELNNLLQNYKQTLFYKVGISVLKYIVKSSK